MLLRWIGCLSGVLWLISGCASTLPTTVMVPEEKPVQDGQMPAERPQESAVDVPKITPPPQSSGVPTSADCLPLKEGRNEIPAFVEAGHFMVTRILKHCQTPEGRPGLEKGSMWTAMGFPCTGGNGRIIWRGKYNDPDTLSFPLLNTCPMEPKDQSEVSRLAAEDLGIGTGVVLGAFYPFAVQFWEWVDFKEADLGNSLEMRGSQTVAEIWKQLKAKGRVKFRLYGRENSWVNDGDVLYLAEGTIGMVGSKNFDVRISSARRATADDIAAGKSICLRVRTDRECSPVFNQ